MTKHIANFLTATFLLTAILAAVTAAYAQPENLQIDVCHATGSESNPYVQVTVNINSVADAENVGGHGNHANDAWEPYTFGDVDYPGQGDMAACEGTPPADPTPTATPLPTDIPPTTETPNDPTPTATLTDNPGSDPTTVPTDTEPSPTPSDTNPTVDLPNTGSPFGIGPNTVWQEPRLPANLYLGHNGSGGIGEDWVLLDIGSHYTSPYIGGDYEVAGRMRVLATDTWVLDTIRSWNGVSLLTCSGYNPLTGEWKYRVVLFLIALN